MEVATVDSSRAERGSLPMATIAAMIAVIPICEHVLRGIWGYEIGQVFAAGLLEAGTIAVLLHAATGNRGERSSPNAGFAGNRGWRMPSGTAAALLAAFAGSALVSSLLRIPRGDLAATFPGLSRVFLAVLAFLLVAGLDRVRAGRWLGFGLLTGGALASVYALAQRFGGGLERLAPAVESLRSADPGMAGMMDARIAAGRAFSFFVYPNALAGFLVMSLPVAAAGWRAATGSAPRAGYAGLTLLLAGGLLVSGSVGGTAALAVAFLVLALDHGRRTGRLFLAASAATGFSLFLAAVILRPTALPSGLEARMAMWKTAIRAPVTATEAVFGRGPGRYGDAVGRTMPAGLRSRHAHNWLVETWIEQGALGVLLLAAVLAAVVRSALAPGTLRVFPGLVIGLLAALAHSLVDFDHALPALAFPFWCLAGLFAVPGKPAGRIGIMEGKTAAVARGALRHSAVIIAVVLAVIPFFRGPGSWIFLGAVIGAIVGLLVFVRLAGIAISPVDSKSDLPWPMLGAIAAIWVFVSPAPGEAYQRALVFAGLAGAGLLARIAAGTADGEKRLRSGVLVVMTGYAAWAVGESLTGHGPALAAFPSPNFLAAFLVFGYGLGLSSMLAGAFPGRFAAVTAVAAGVGIILTRSAGAMFAAAGLTAALLAVSAHRSKKSWLRLAAGVGKANGRWMTSAWPTWLAAGAIAVPLAAVWLGAPAVNALSVIQRQAMWREAVRMIEAGPGGCGPGRYADAVGPYREPSVTAAGIGRYSLRTVFAHNEPLQFAAEWGTPALGLLAWGLVMALMASRGAGTFWAWGAAGLLFHSLVDFPLRAPPILLLFAVGIGAASAGTPRRARNASGRGSWLALAAAVLTAVAFIRPPMARWMVDRAGNTVPGMFKGAVLGRQAFPLYASAWGLEARAWDKLVIEQPCERCVPRALEVHRTAIGLSGGKADEYISLGLLNLGMAVRVGRPATSRMLFTDAHAAFLAAARVDPASAVPWENAAVAFIFEKRYQEAGAALKEALRREPNDLGVYAYRIHIAEAKRDAQAIRLWKNRYNRLRESLLRRPGPNACEQRLMDLEPSPVVGRQP